MNLRVGVISDTHGLLRPQAIAALEGSHHILHAGDVGDPAILERLQQIGPVTAIRGNIDTQGECALLPATAAVELGGQLFYLLHSLADLDLNPAAAQVAVVVSGHSHKALITQEKEVIFLNPGSAGPRRFNLPVTLAIVTIDSNGLHPELIAL